MDARQERGLEETSLEGMRGYQCRLSRVQAEDGAYLGSVWLLLRLLSELPVILLGELREVKNERTHNKKV